MKQLLKASLRLEKKLDELLNDVAAREAKASGVPRARIPLNYSGQSCPLCQKPVVYQPVQIVGLDGVETLLVRMCDCEPKSKELPISEGDLP